MAIPAFNVENVSASDIFIETLGINFPAGASRNILQKTNLWSLCRSEDFRTNLSSGDLEITVYTDSTTSATYTTADALKFLDGLAFGGFHADQHIKGGEDVIDADKLQVTVLSSNAPTGTDTNYSDSDHLGAVLNAFNIQLGFGHGSVAVVNNGTTVSTGSSIPTIAQISGVSGFSNKLWEVVLTVSWVGLDVGGGVVAQDAKIYLETTDTLSPSTVEVELASKAVGVEVLKAFVFRSSGGGSFSVTAKIEADNVVDVQITHATMTLRRIDPVTLIEYETGTGELSSTAFSS